LHRQVCEDVLRKERPDGCIVSMGGQTALNVGIELYRCGAFDRHQCRVLGTSIETIIATEDRQLFAERLHGIQETLARSASAETVEEAAQVAAGIGYPVLVRAGKCRTVRCCVLLNPYITQLHNVYGYCLCFFISIRTWWPRVRFRGE
jgi:carbamoylphosphate synthase large subunit